MVSSWLSWRKEVGVAKSTPQEFWAYRGFVEIKKKLWKNQRCMKLLENPCCFSHWRGLGLFFQSLGPPTHSNKLPWRWDDRVHRSLRVVGDQPSLGSRPLKSKWLRPRIAPHDVHGSSPTKKLKPRDESFFAGDIKKSSFRGRYITNANNVSKHYEGKIKYT